VNDRPVGLRDSLQPAYRLATPEGLMMRRAIVLSLCGAAALGGCASVRGEASQGDTVELTAEDQAAMSKIGQKVSGRIVWSSSRIGNHDLFMMKPDGSGVVQLTKGDQVDWFPRFSIDGKTVLFARSKSGWVSERDCNVPHKWDLYTVGIDGTGEQLRIKDATWGTWIGADEIVFARGTKVFSALLSTGAETLLVDSEKEAPLGGAELQQPQLSPDRKFLAITLRGSGRATGIFDLTARTWVATGEGCQINWHPSGQRIYWVNTSGNGGSEVLSEDVDAGKPKAEYTLDQQKLIDIPGRRSHEYFPQLAAGGKWLVWAATQRGHDHDTADYEIYLWQVGAPPEEATRLTFHSANDRWPDLFVEDAAP
jgi:Tol biopolymer transport system component